MKKMFFIVVLSLLLTACTSFSDVKEIETVNLQNGENFILEKDSQDANIILDALIKKNKTDEDVSSLPNYEIKLIKENDQEVYKLYLDIDNKAAYLGQASNLYRIKDNVAKELFLSNAFSYIYVDATIYDSYLDLGGKKLSPQIEYNWNSKNIDGHFVNNYGNLKEKYEKANLVTISQFESVDLKYEKEPDSQTVKVYSGDHLISTGKNLQDVLSNIKDDGQYLVECHSQWHSKEGLSYYGNQTIRFDVLVDRPASLNIITKENSPGNILLISVENLNGDETIKISTNAVKIENDIYSYKDKMYYMFPIDLYAQPGDYALSALINQGTDKEYSFETTLTVANKNFKTQYLTVSEEMNETNNDNTAIYEFVQLVKPARTESAKEKLWEGTFIMPVEGRLTTDFAEIRYVNNEPSSSRHSGLDLAAPRGTPVLAPNNGIVTFAMEGLLSPGNTVVIDHGMGLFTSYYHLDTIDVEKGAEVKKGSTIGSVGSTGFSTGPHLHYAVSIYNTYVNPYQTLNGIID